jgi:acyl carrier protein
MHSRDEIIALIIETVRLFRAVNAATDLRSVAIYGDGGIDSMGLVIFLAELEARLAETTGRDLVLANEKALSRSSSPYREAGTLADFVLELLREEVVRP